MVARIHVARVGMHGIVAKQAHWRSTTTPWRALMTLALLSLALATALTLDVDLSRVTIAATTRHAGALVKQGSSELSLTVDGAISAALGAANGSYRLEPSASAIEAANPAQRLRASFRADGVRIHSGASVVGLNLHTVGYGDAFSAVQAVKPSIYRDRVLYARAGLSEWYANGPLGVEQGFTLWHPPSGLPTGPLTLSMGLSGNVHASLDYANDGITLSHSGGPSLHYGGLVAIDARGRMLRAWLELHGGLLLLRMDAAGARYPLRIDPFVQQETELKGGGESGEGQFGFSVALSGDGNTALIGAPDDNGEVGAAWVFTRSGSTWTQQGSKLKGSGEVGKSQFGFGVALSGDGETALIGGPADHGGIGAVWAFAHSGSKWSHQGGKLVGAGDIDLASFGYSTALSSNGDTALIGAPQSEERCLGGAWTFVRSGTTWTQQANLVGQRPVCPSPDSRDDYGASVALSADGDTALVGLPPAGPINDTGAAVFTRIGATWTPQANLNGLGGSAVALSSAGDLALLAGWAPFAGAFPGTAEVFTRAGSAWSRQEEQLTASGEVEFGEYGQGAALSSSGETALVGGPRESAGGGAWVFTSVGPRVTAVEPREGPPAGETRVTITGANFTDATNVRFGSIEAKSFTVNSATSITAMSPASTGTVNVTVTNPEATSSVTPADEFSYVGVPTVTKISPTRGPSDGGTIVTLTGSHFTGVTAVHFGDIEANIFMESDGSLGVSTPAGTAGTVNVTVTDPAGTSALSSRDRFTFERPTVTDLSPASGPVEGGTLVTVDGSGFSPGSGTTKLRFGTAPASSVDCSSTTTCTGVAPKHKAGSVDVTALVNAMASTKNPPGDQFNYH